MREPRAFAELETKIGQEEKPAQKPAEPKKEQPKLGSFKSDKPLMKDDVEQAKKLGMDKDEYKYQSDTAMSILLGRELPSKKDYAKNPAEKSKAPKQEELFKEFDQEFEDWGDYIYGGLNPEEQAKTLAERKKVPYETAKSYIDTMAKDRENAYKDALAQFPRIEKAIAEAYPQGSDDYKTFDSQFIGSILFDSLPHTLGSDQTEKLEKEFAKYLYSKGYKDVSNNPIVEYGEQREGNQLQDELEGLVADLKATSQANKEPLEYDERFLEDATGYLTKSLDEQGKAEINRQFKEMLDKAGFKNITPGAETSEEKAKNQEALRRKFGSTIFPPTQSMPYWTFDDPYWGGTRKFKTEEEALDYAGESLKRHNDWVSKEATRLINDFRQGKVTTKDLKQFGRSEYVADILTYLLGKIK